MKILAIASLVVTVVLFAGSAHAANAPGTYTWEQAVAAGLEVVQDFEAPPELNLPPCPPPDLQDPGLGENEIAPDDGPECYQAPEDQDLLIVVPESTDPIFPPQDPGPDPAQYRFGGSANDVGNVESIEGGKNLAEISDPSLDGPGQRFYSRISVLSPVDNAFEVGWSEGTSCPGTQMAISGS